MTVLVLETPLARLSFSCLGRRKIKFNANSDAAARVANNQKGVLGGAMNREMQIPINDPPFTNAIFFQVLMIFSSKWHSELPAHCGGRRGPRRWRRRAHESPNSVGGSFCVLHHISKDIALQKKFDSLLKFQLSDHRFQYLC